MDNGYGIFRCLQVEVMENNEDGLVWEDDIASMPNCFAGYCQVFNEKTATSLKSSANVTYPVHKGLVKFL